MTKYYLMPSGKFPVDGDGAPLLITKAEFEECCCECEYCDGSMPDEYNVEIADIANNACNSCTLLNDTYVLTKSGDCSYTWSGNVDFCQEIMSPGSEPVTITLEFLSGKVRVTMVTTVLGGSLDRTTIWEKSYGSEPSCELTDTLSYVSSQLHSDGYCDVDGSTASISPV